MGQAKKGKLGIKTYKLSRSIKIMNKKFLTCHLLILLCFKTTPKILCASIIEQNPKTHLSLEDKIDQKLFEESDTFVGNPQYENYRLHSRISDAETEKYLNVLDFNDNVDSELNLEVEYHNIQGRIRDFHEKCRQKNLIVSSSYSKECRKWIKGHLIFLNIEVFKVRKYIEYHKNHEFSLEKENYIKNYKIYFKAWINNQLFLHTKAKENLFYNDLRLQDSLNHLDLIMEESLRRERWDYEFKFRDLILKELENLEYKIQELAIHLELREKYSDPQFKNTISKQLENFKFMMIRDQEEIYFIKKYIYNSRIMILTEKENLEKQKNWLIFYDWAIKNALTATNQNREVMLKNLRKIKILYEKKFHVDRNYCSNLKTVINTEVDYCEYILNR